MSKLKYLNDKDPWLLGEDIPDIDFFFSQIWLSSFVNEFSWPSGKAYEKALCIYKGYHLWFYFGEKDSKEVGDNIVNKFIKNPNFVKNLNNEIVEWADKLRKYCDKLPETNLDRYSNKKLWQFYKKHDEIHTKYYQWCWIPVACDMFHSNLTDRLKQYLREINIPEDKLNEIFILLTQPSEKSLIQVEQNEFLEIAIKIKKDNYHDKIFKELYRKFKEEEVAKFGYQTHSKEYERLFEKSVEKIKDKIKPHIYKLIQKHYSKYFYIEHMWVGKVTSFEYYLKELVKIVGSDIDLEAKYKDEQREFNKTLSRRKKLIKKLNLKNPWLSIFNGFGDFMVTKIYRRFAQIYAIYKMEYILQEIGKILKFKLKRSKVYAAQRNGRCFIKK